MTLLSVLLYHVNNQLLGPSFDSLKSLCNSTSLSAIGKMDTKQHQIFLIFT